MGKRKKGKALRGCARIVEERPLGVQEASGVAYLGGGTFLVVDDEAGIFRCDDSQTTALEAGKGLRDLEGICISADGAHAYVLTERDGSVWRFALAGGELSDGVRLGRLPRLNNRKNQGWEGISFVPAGTFSERAELVAVHQTSPRRVSFFDAESLAERLSLRLPKNARKELGELNDVALHPVSKRVFVVSGKAGKLGELVVSDGGISLVRVYPLATERGDVPEGIAIDADGRVWIVTDGEGMLREMKLNA